MRANLTRISILTMVVAFALTLVIGMQRGNSQGPVILPNQLPLSGAQWIFSPPFGWNRVQATTQGLGIWVHPGESAYPQTIAARADTFNGTLATYAQMIVKRIEAAHPGAKVGRLQQTTVCSGHPATYVPYEAMVKGKPVVFETVMTTYPGTAYYATYSKLSTAPTIHEARQSLLSLCGGHPPAIAAHASPSPNGPAVPYHQTALPAMTTTQPMQTYGPPAATITPRLGGP